MAGVDESDIRGEAGIKDLICNGVFQLSSIGIVITRADGTLLKANDALLEMLGYTEEEFVGKHYTEITHPHDFKKNEDFFQRLLASEDCAAHVEKRYLAKNGEWIWTHVSARVIRATNGTPEYFLTNIEDIRGIRQLELEQANSLKETNALLNATKTALEEVDFKEATRSIFESCRILVGAGCGYVSLRSADGREHEVICIEPGGLPHDSSPDFDRSLWKFREVAYREKRVVYENNYANSEYMKDVPHNYVRLENVLLAPVALEGGSVGMMAYGEKSGGFSLRDAAVVKAFSDLTAIVLQRQQAFEETQRFQSSIAQFDRLSCMGQLASGVSHELNNPLAYTLYNVESVLEDMATLEQAITVAQKQIKGIRELPLGVSPQSLQQLALFVSDGELKQRLEAAFDGLVRMKDISTALGTFSKIDEDEVVPVHLESAIDAALNMVFHEIKYRAKLVKQFSDVPPVVASTGRMSQLFLTLLLNAVEAIDDGDLDNNEINVRTWKDGENVCVCISDTGCGIPIENMARLYDPFFTTKEVAGTGLGLSICKNIITDLGGEISLESIVGRGTQATIRIPVLSGKMNNFVSDEIDKLPSSFVAKGRILVIDDEPGIRTAVGRILRDHEIVEAASGAAGIEILAKDNLFDVIICDMMMPQTSGIDLHRWICKNLPDMASSVLFMTGGVFVASAREYLKAFDSVIFEKPFDRKRIKDVVEQRIQKKHRNATT